MPRELTLADGQVAASATSIYAGSASPAKKVTVTFTNVGGQSETLVVTFTRAGGTARRVLRHVLAANEAVVLRGLPMQADDTLLAATSNATSVDYLVTDGSDSPFEIVGFDGNGALKQVNTGVSGNQSISGNLSVTGTLTQTGAATFAALTRFSTGTVAAAGSVQGDAGAVTAQTTTVTASDGTKGVVLPTAVAGMEIVVVNTVSGQNLKIYPASGAAIDYAAADAAYTLAGRKHAMFRATSATQWYAILTA